MRDEHWRITLKVAATHEPDLVSYADVFEVVYCES